MLRPELAADALADPNRGALADSDGNTDADSDTHSVRSAHPDSNADADSDANPNAYSDLNAYSDSNASELPAWKVRFLSESLLRGFSGDLLQLRL